MSQYLCLRNCYVGEQLWKKDKAYNLPEGMDKDPKNFRPLDISAELYEEVTEEALNKAHEAKLKVANKPEKMRKGYYWCTECQQAHNSEPNNKGKISKIAKKHLKFRAE